MADNMQEDVFITLVQDTPKGRTRDLPYVAYFVTESKFGGKRLARALKRPRRTIP